MSPGRSKTDAELIRDARAGDARGYEMLFKKYHNLVYVVTYKYLQDQEEALDATQESFIKAFRGLARFREGASFKTWLARIACNTAIDRVRGRGRRDKEISLEGAASLEALAAEAARRPRGPVEELETRELQEAVSAAIDQLGDKHRQVILLSSIEEMSYQEMAEALGISRGTVMSRLYHARKKLRQILARKGLL